MFEYKVTINDGHTNSTYYFQSKSGGYSIEFLAGMFAGCNHDLKLIPPSEASIKKSDEETNLKQKRH